MGRTRSESVTMRVLVSRIATKFAAKENQVARVLQTWVTSGLLIPHGPVHPGPGQYRGFQEGELWKAALLYECHHYSLPIHQLRYIRAWFDTPWEANVKILQDAAHGKEMYFYYNPREERGIFKNSIFHVSPSGFVLCVDTLLKDL